MERLYTDTNGVNDRAEEEAVRWLLRYALDHGSDRAAIIIPSMDSASNLSRILGNEDAATLVSNRAIPFRNIHLELFTHRTLTRAEYPGPVLVLWSGRTEVERVERLNPPALCAVQWVDGELTEWARTWGATELLTGTSEQAELAPPVVRGAVLAMSRSGDVSHPSDKHTTIRALKMMRLAGVPIDTDVLHAEALRQGWSTSGAEGLCDLATKVAEGRRVRGGGRVTKTEAKEAATRWEAAGIYIPAAGQDE